MTREEAEDLRGYLYRKLNREPTRSELAEEIRKAEDATRIRQATEERRNQAPDPFDDVRDLGSDFVNQMRQAWAREMGRQRAWGFEEVPREPPKAFVPSDKREFMADQSRGNDPLRANYALNAQRKVLRMYVEAYPAEFYEALGKYELEELNLKVQKINANYSGNPNYTAVTVPEAEKTKVPAAEITTWLYEHTELYPIHDLDFEMA